MKQIWMDTMICYEGFYIASIDDRERKAGDLVLNGVFFSSEDSVKSGLRTESRFVTIVRDYVSSLPGSETQTMYVAENEDVSSTVNLDIRYDNDVLSCKSFYRQSLVFPTHSVNT